MVNIRGARKEDKISYIKARIDTFQGEEDFYDIPNEVLMKEKNKYELEFDKYINNTSIIINEGVIVGCFSLYSYMDGILFYIYMMEEYKEKNILSNVINYIKSSNRGYLYTIIHKEDVKVYQDTGFNVIGENDKQYKLKIDNN